MSNWCAWLVPAGGLRETSGWGNLPYSITALIVRGCRKRDCMESVQNLHCRTGRMERPVVLRSQECFRVDWTSGELQPSIMSQSQAISVAWRKNPSPVGGAASLPASQDLAKSIPAASGKDAG